MSTFLVQHGGEIGRLTFEHLWLTASAMLFACAIALPLGVLLTRRQALARPVIGVANVLQTIPSLAMFGLLLPVPFLGERAARLAIVALTAYALLPILRNTYAGINSVDPAVIDVANALGMTGWQRLRKVELPMAASVILAGLRTATVTCVGVATIAAAIGAGGLGELIFRGVASVDNGLVLAGAMPAALLALCADGIAGVPGEAARGAEMKAAPALLALLALTACAPPSGSHMVIGAKNFTEQVVLGELLAQEIEASGRREGRAEVLAGGKLSVPAGAGVRTHRWLRGVHQARR